MLRKMKAYIIDAMSSNSMKSPNPYSGIHATEVSKCLDTRCLEPSCNQGGVMVCIALEGNGARPSHLGKGFSVDGTMYTLNTIEQHSVCYPVCYQKTVGALCADDWRMINKQYVDQSKVVCYRKSCKPYGKDGLGEKWMQDDITNTLNCFEFAQDSRTPEIVVQKRTSYSVDCRNNCLNEEVSSTLQAKPQGGWSVNVTNPVMIVNGDGEY